MLVAANVFSWSSLLLLFDFPVQYTKLEIPLGSGGGGFYSEKEFVYEQAIHCARSVEVVTLFLTFKLNWDFYRDSVLSVHMSGLIG